VVAEVNGRRVRRMGRSFTDPTVVGAGLLVFLRSSARYQRTLGVSLDARGAPRRHDDLTSVAGRYALICLTPTEKMDEARTNEEAQHGAGVHT
jgi:hypothetical protein